MKKLVLALLLMVTAVHTWAQEAQNNVQDTPKQAATPQEPRKHGQQAHSSKLKSRAAELPNYGSLVIDWGLNFLRDRPQEMDLICWGSRFSNVYYYYNIRLGQSRFAISPGIGIGSEGYRFKEKDEKYYTLVRNEVIRDTEFKYAHELFPKSKKILQSSLDLRYVDFMLEVRLSANRKYPKESFFVALGGKVGMLWHASTTVKYKEDDQIKQQVAREFFNLNKMRSAVHARLGWERFSLFYTQTLPFSTLFNKDRGPSKTTTQPYNVGLSVDLF